MLNIVLFGTGGHAKVVADIVRRQGVHQVVGLVSSDGVAGDFVPGCDVIADNDNFMSAIDKAGAQGAIVALGNINVKMSLVEKIKEHLEFVTAVHPSAIIDPTVNIGLGTVVMPSAVINASTLIGSHCIINTACSIDHDCSIGDYTHICPGVNIAGHVNIGREVWIGIGSVLIDQITIGERVVTGAGSVVVAPVGSDMKIRGVPAKQE